MSTEGQLMDKKSLRAVLGKQANWKEIAKDVVAFSNAQGGRLLIGIEDDAKEPPIGQSIPDGLLNTIINKISSLTINVTISPMIKIAENGGEFIEIAIPISRSIASTSDGKFYIRIADNSKPVTGDEFLRLAGERTAFPWETLTNGTVSKVCVDEAKWRNFCSSIRLSERVKQSVKEKSDDELLEHYLLADGEYLTNLGILCIGKRTDRAKLGSAPVVQFIKYDENDAKVNKIVWDDYSLNPMEMLEAIWNEVPDWKESYEFPDGLYRQNIAHYDKTVVRELLINALVHRPYTQRGDIYINLYPDRLQIVNPGLLPLGVTTRNILHASVRRNENLAKMFHDLKLMEREGSGYDAVYDVLLSQGKQRPELEEGADYFSVTVRRRIYNTQIINFVAMADQTYQLSQRERICLCILAQQEVMTAVELCDFLDLKDAVDLKPWLGRLINWRLVHTRGQTKGMTYRISPEMIRSLKLVTKTTLKDIEPHRLSELICTDLKKYKNASISEIHSRIGLDIPRRNLQRSLSKLIADGMIDKTGLLKQTRYHWPSDL